MENKSYEGGWTWYNPKIVNKVVKCDGSSFDSHKFIFDNSVWFCTRV